MFKVLVLGLLGYVCYRFFTRYIWPVVKVVRAARQKMEESRQQMNNRSQSSVEKEQPNQQTASQPEGEYIDYEEVE